VFWKVRLPDLEKVRMQIVSPQTNSDEDGLRTEAYNTRAPAKTGKREG
jgi:hypothetical protein